LLFVIFKGQLILLFFQSDAVGELIEEDEESSAASNDSGYNASL